MNDLHQFTFRTWIFHSDLFVYRRPEPLLRRHQGRLLTMATGWPTHSVWINERWFYANCCQTIVISLFSTLILNVKRSNFAILSSTSVILPSIMGMSIPANRDLTLKTCDASYNNKWGTGSKWKNTYWNWVYHSACVSQKETRRTGQQRISRDRSWRL